MWSVRDKDRQRPRNTVDFTPGYAAHGSQSRRAVPSLAGARYERLDLLRIELEDREKHTEADNLSEDDAGGAWDETHTDDYLNLHELERSDSHQDFEDDEDDQDDEGNSGDGECQQCENDDSVDEGRPCHRFVDDTAAETAVDPSRGRRRQRATDVSNTSKRATPAVSVELMTSLFGPQSAARPPDAPELIGCESDDDCSEVFTASSKSMQASRLRTERELFAVPGVECIGCCLGSARLRHLDAFVADHATSTQPEALWRLAASVYVDTVVTPCQREGVVAPPWSKEGVRLHYEHHALYSKLTRVAVLREMRGVREMLVRRLVRVDDEGEREADHKTTDQYLKLVAAESREYAQLLAMDTLPSSRRTASVPVRGSGRAAAPGGSDANRGDVGGPSDG